MGTATAGRGSRAGEPDLQGGRGEAGRRGARGSLRGRVRVESAKSAWKSRWQGFRGSWYLLSLSTSLFLGARGEPGTHPSPSLRPSRAGGSRLGTWWGRACGAAAGLGTPRGVGSRGICLNLSLRFCGPNSHTQNHTERAPCSHLGCHDRRRASGCGRSGESGPRPPGLPTPHFQPLVESFPRPWDRGQVAVSSPLTCQRGNFSASPSVQVHVQPAPAASTAVTPDCPSLSLLQDPLPPRSRSPEPVQGGWLACWSYRHILPPCVDVPLPTHHPRRTARASRFQGGSTPTLSPARESESSTKSR